jgi:hypothetical protein
MGGLAVPEQASIISEQSRLCDSRSGPQHSFVMTKIKSLVSAGPGKELLRRSRALPRSMPLAFVLCC